MSLKALFRNKYEGSYETLPSKNPLPMIYFPTMNLNSKRKEKEDKEIKKSSIILETDWGSLHSFGKESEIKSNPYINYSDGRGEGKRASTSLSHHLRRGKMHHKRKKEHFNHVIKINDESIFAASSKPSSITQNGFYKRYIDNYYF